MKRLLAEMYSRSRILVVFGLLALAFCFAMFQGGFVSWFIFFTLLPFLLYSILLRFVPLRMEEVSRVIRPGYIERDEHVYVTVRFVNNTLFPLLFVVVREALIPDAFYQSMHTQPSKVFLVGFRREFEWTYELRNAPRGEHQLQGLKFVATDFFGWMEKHHEVQAFSTFIVYPKITEMKNASFRLQYEQGSTATKFSLMKDTSIATGVREYQPGDRFSWIHWKSFAKNGELRTKEFEDRQSQKLFVYLHKSAQPNFEQAVDLAASMVKSLVKVHADVSFLTGGQQYVQFPDLKTEKQAEKVLHYLAAVKADATNPITSYISKEGQVQNAVLLIATSDLSDELLALLMTGSKYAKAIICFVIVTKEQMRAIPPVRNFAGENRIIYMTSEMIAAAFAEVNKP